MKYINQIMKETLRINSPIPSVIPRVATEDTELSGVFIPKGTMVAVNMFEIQHNKKYWKDGDQFNPDRFSEDVEKGGDSTTWLPFGNGPRQCIGMNFSLTEQRVMLSMMCK
jgi:cytochrome P450